MNFIHLLFLFSFVSCWDYMKVDNHFWGWIGQSMLNHQFESKFKVGDVVRVQDNIDDPLMGWGKIDKLMVGRVSGLSVESCKDTGHLLYVDFETHKKWIGCSNEMEIVNTDVYWPFYVGQCVRIKSDVTDPFYGWGKVQKKDIGQINELPIKPRQCGNNGWEVIVDFASKKKWYGCSNELEPIGDEFKCYVGQRLRTWYRTNNGIMDETSCKQLCSHSEQCTAFWRDSTYGWCYTTEYPASESIKSSFRDTLAETLKHYELSADWMKQVTWVKSRYTTNKVDQRCF